MRQRKRTLTEKIWNPRVVAVAAIICLALVLLAVLVR
jgi:hypothetical protein